MEKIYGIEVADKEKYLRIREELLKHKQTILTTQFDELNGIINITQFSRRYFDKGHAWFSQKLHNSLVLSKNKQFTSSEIKQIAESYRDLANQLLSYADELDAAKDYGEIKK